MKKILLTSFIALGICANAQCEAITTFPTTWNFEGTTGGNLPNCWTTIQNGDYNLWNVWTADGSYGTTNGTKLLNNAVDAGKTGSAWAFTRPFALTAGKTYSVKFTSLANNSSNNLVLAVGFGPNAVEAGMNIIGTDNTNTLAHEMKTYMFSPTTSGTYYLGFDVYCTSGNATQSSILVDDVVVDEAILAVSDINGKSKITAYPNPVKDILKLSDIKGVKSISVTDMSGRQVKNLAPSNEINLSNLKAGNYVISLIMENGSLQNINIIKQ